jgi:spore maturation protein CgeB
MHTDRKQVLDRLIARLEPMELRIVVDGELSSRLRPWRHRRTCRQYPSLAAVARNRRVSHEEINLMTNRARICLNLLPGQAREALNVRAYEICGAGGFQLINRRPIPTGLLEHGIDAVGCASPEEMAEQVRSYLAPGNRDRRHAMAAAARERASASMTFDVRVAELLDRVDACCPGAP